MTHEATPKLKPRVTFYGIKTDGTKVLLEHDGHGVFGLAWKMIAQRNLAKWNEERREIVDGSSSN